MDSEQFEAGWRLAQRAIPPAIIGAWAAVGVVVALFIVRFREDWREGVKAGVALVAASVALGCLVCWRRAQTLPDAIANVDQVVAFPDAMRDKRLRVYGSVACGSVGRRSDTDDYRFKIQGLPSQADVVLEVRYAGLIPRGFTEGKLVVASGKLAADGVLDVVEGGIVVSSCAYSLPLDCDP